MKFEFSVLTCRGKEVCLSPTSPPLMGVRESLSHSHWGMFKVNKQINHAIRPFNIQFLRFSMSDESWLLQQRNWVFHECSFVASILRSTLWTIQICLVFHEYSFLASILGPDLWTIWICLSGDRQFFTFLIAFADPRSSEWLVVVVGIGVLVWGKGEAELSFICSRNYLPQS